MYAKIYIIVSGPSHFVVRFSMDETVCIVPRKKILSSSTLPSVGDCCDVQWSSGEILTATVFASGKY